MVLDRPMDGTWVEEDMAWFGGEDDQEVRQGGRQMLDVAEEGGSDYHVSLCKRLYPHTEGRVVFILIGRDPSLIGYNQRDIT